MASHDEVYIVLDGHFVVAVRTRLQSAELARAEYAERMRFPNDAYDRTIIECHRVAE